MNDFLSSLLCCRPRRKAVSEAADEISPLIQPVQGVPSLAYDAIAVDNHRAKERLDVIVRAKEGKMVNVLSRVPFNLRNDPQSGQANTSSPSRSNRSISVNLNRPAIRALDANDASSRASSPKPSPSISRSESASSIHHASSSHISTTDDFDHEPILKARLVSTPKNKARVFSRRGRSKTRQSRFTEDGSPVDSTPILEGIQSVDSGRGGTEHQGHGGDFGDLHQASTLPEGEGPEVKQLSEEDKAVIESVSNDISASLQNGFKIQDVGTIACSWGD